MNKILFKFKVNDVSFYIYKIYSQHIDLDVKCDDGKGFRSLIFFDKDRKLDWETKERNSKINFKYPKEFKVAAQKFLNLKAFS